MSPIDKQKIEHLAWAIESRYRNQKCAVRLLSLFKEHDTKWKTMTWSRAAQDLLAVSFSLWRAAFLADKTAKRRAVFSHGVDFLEKVIEDNAISYVQDRKSNEWTFNYYTRNARASLEMLHAYWPEDVPAYVGKKRNPIERWDYCQELLDKAVEAFATLAQASAARTLAANQKRDTRLAAKERKIKSRAVTLANRAKSTQSLAALGGSEPSLKPVGRRTTSA